MSAPQVSPPQTSLSRTRIALVTAGAFALWVNAFGLGLFPFWPALVVAALGVMLLAFFNQGVPPDWRRVAWQHWPLGIIHGVVLYAFFGFGDWVTSWLLPNQSADLGGLYTLLGSGANWQAFLLVLLAVMAEEFFWRGFLQRQLQDLVGIPRAILIATLCYSVAHLGLFSPILTLATITAGLAWGSLYAWQRALFPVFLSHLVFDVLAIFLFPFV